MAMTGGLKIEEDYAKMDGAFVPKSQPPAPDPEITKLNRALKDADDINRRLERESSEQKQEIAHLRALLRQYMPR
jgi:hypothetical protein